MISYGSDVQILFFLQLNNKRETTRATVVSDFQLKLQCLVRSTRNNKKVNIFVMTKRFG